MNDPVPSVRFADACRYWAVLGFVNFGGPTGQIAMMHRDLVERRRWISEERFLHALNYCVLLPGPEAQQLAIYVGWLLHGTRGGLVAGIAFVLPSVFISARGRGSYTYVAASRFGALLRSEAAVVAIVLEASIRIGNAALKTALLVAIAAALRSQRSLGCRSRGGPRRRSRIRSARPAGLVGVDAAASPTRASRAAPRLMARAAAVVASVCTSRLLPIVLLILWRGPGALVEALFSRRRW
jgi:chromate transport protein ChrA